MYEPLLAAADWFAHPQRIWGLDWSYLTVLGLIGNAAFSCRFLIQWIASERKGESVVPEAFWYWSIGGSILLALYFVLRHDPVGILAYLPNSMIYLRNLHLIHKRKLATATALSTSPAEEA
jgi:lipid-A-disaccharide synthase-like uncharacterized protein